MSRRTPLLVTAALLAGAVVGGVTTAVAASTSPTICADKKSGDLSLAKKSCSSKQKKVAIAQTGPQGVPGSPGPSGAAGSPGAKGTTGNDGHDGTSPVLSITPFDGAIADTTLTSTTVWTFMGPTALVTTSAGQRITASATAVLYQSANANPLVDTTLCYKAEVGSPSAPTPLVPDTDWSLSNLPTSLRTVIPATVSTTSAGAGIFFVGFCAKNDSDGGPSVTTVFNDSANGWVQVTG